MPKRPRDQMQAEQIARLIEALERNDPAVRAQMEALGHTLQSLIASMPAMMQGVYRGWLALCHCLGMPPDLDPATARVELFRWVDGTPKAKVAVHNEAEAEAAFIRQVDRERRATGYAASRGVHYQWARGQRPFHVKNSMIDAWRDAHLTEAEKKGGRRPR